MMESILATIIIGIAAFIFVWGIGAYVSINPNMFEWSEAGRAMQIILWFGIWVIGAAIYHDPL